MYDDGFRLLLVRQHNEALDRSARLRVVRHPPSEPREAADETLALRLCRVNDDAALMRLAELEGKPAPRGRFVIAELNGTIVAAQPLDGGPPLADPFRRTAHLLPLLRLRAAQLAPSQRGASRWQALVLRRAVRRA